MRSNDEKQQQHLDYQIERKAFVVIQSNDQERSKHIEMLVQQFEM